jgi:hypothetical protein
MHRENTVGLGHHRELGSVEMNGEDAYEVNFTKCEAQRTNQ